MKQKKRKEKLKLCLDKYIGKTSKTKHKCVKQQKQQQQQQHRVTELWLFRRVRFRCVK